MSGLNPCSAAGLEEFCQALVFEASNHSLIVPCNVSGVKAHNAVHTGASLRASDGRQAGLWLRRSQPSISTLHSASGATARTMRGKNGKPPTAQIFLIGTPCR